MRFQTNKLVWSPQSLSCSNCQCAALNVSMANGLKNLFPFFIVTSKLIFLNWPIF